MKQNNFNQKQNTKRMPAMLTVEAHEVLPNLRELISKEKNIPVSFKDVASLAILDYHRRALLREQRRQARLQVTA